MSAPDVISHSHGARVDTRMHRPSVILADLDADEYGAPEGGRLPGAEPSVFTNCYFAAEDAPRDEPAPRIPRGRPPAAGAVYWGVVAASLVFACYFIGVHVLASWGQQ